ncbi:MAG: type II secretion system protein N [bacterium]
MKHNLWIVNSSLLIIFGITLSLNQLLKQDVPILIKKVITEKEEKKTFTPTINIKKICEQDIFGTYSPTPISEPKQKELITPIPEYTPHKITPPIEQPKQEFVDPLKIKINGIISSSNEEKSIAMISDETNKEKTYRLGDKIIDGQIIKISKNKVILLRSNGQQEILLLRAEDKPGEKIPEKWKYVIKKIDENNFNIDPKEFCKKIETLGQLIEEFALIPAYQKGNVIGMRVGNAKENQIASAFGLKKDDIIISINNINTSDTKDRIKIYDEAIQAQLGDKIEFVLSRNKQNLNISYKLEKIDKPKKKMFLQPATTGEDQTPKVEAQLKLSEEQEKEKRLREFEKTHRTPKQQDVIQDIRQRILESMKSRSQNRRVR